ncbi:MAG: hypothetical protein WCC57_07240 [Paracoccaceae bacterium]
MLRETPKYPGVQDESRFGLQAPKSIPLWRRHRHGLRDKMPIAAAFGKSVAAKCSTRLVMGRVTPN